MKHENELNMNMNMNMNIKVNEKYMKKDMYMQRKRYESMIDIPKGIRWDMLGTHNRKA